MVAELGLRYRPASGAALEEHREAVELLARDIADIPPDRLETAISDWVQSNSFMPRAADLVRLAQKQVSVAGRSRGAEWFQAQADRANAELTSKGKHGLRWELDPLGTGLRLTAIERQRPHQPPLTDEEVKDLPRDWLGVGILCGELTPERLRRLNIPVPAGY